MKINYLLEFLQKWTNYGRQTILNEPLEFNFEIKYLKYNDSNTFVNLFMLDNEAWELMKEERLIHPVILAQEIQQVLIDINRDLIELAGLEYGRVGQFFDDFCLIAKVISN